MMLRRFAGAYAVQQKTSGVYLSFINGRYYCLLTSNCPSVTNGASLLEMRILFMNEITVGAWPYRSEVKSISLEGDFIKVH